MKSSKLLNAIFRWRIKHVSDQQFTMILSVLIGIVIGISASLLKTIIHFIEDYLLSGFLSELQQGLLFFLLPLMGIFLVVLFVKFVAKNHLPKSVGYVLFNIGKRNGIFKPIHTFAHIITSALTVAFGGSAGLEGPAVLTGSAIGSNISQLFHLPKKKRLLLIGCGSAAAISALFNSPITGVIFVLEAILVGSRLTFLIPLLIASVSATLTSKILVGKSLLFEFGQLAPVNLRDIPFYILLAICTGVLSVYFIKTSDFLYNKVGKGKDKFTMFAINGSLLGVMLIFFPTLYGEGFFTLRQILRGEENFILTNSLYSSIFNLDEIISHHWFVLAFLLASVLLKVFAYNFTKLAGGNGGVFAPSLFVGGITGFIVSRTINKLDFLSFKLAENNFTLVGMAGVVAGLMHTPLTAIFLIAEITGGYELFVPLMIVVAVAYTTSQKGTEYSYYTKKLAEDGDLLVYDKDKSLLSEIGVLKVIEKDLVTVNDKGTLKDLIAAISNSKRNIFPVVNDENELKGIILLDDVRHLIFDPEKINLSLKHITHSAPALVNYDERMDSVMERFDECGAWNLPVIKEGKYYGFLSKSKIFSVYRDKLSGKDEESY